MWQPKLEMLCETKRERWGYGLKPENRMNFKYDGPARREERRWEVVDVGVCVYSSQGEVKIYNWAREKISCVQGKGERSSNICK